MGTNSTLAMLMILSKIGSLLVINRDPATERPKDLQCTGELHSDRVRFERQNLANDRTKVCYKTRHQVTKGLGTRLWLRWQSFVSNVPTNAFARTAVLVSLVPLWTCMQSITKKSSKGLDADYYVILPCLHVNDTSEGLGRAAVNVNSLRVCRNQHMNWPKRAGCNTHILIV
jgi:hypothetical protein